MSSCALSSISRAGVFAISNDFVGAGVGLVKNTGGLLASLVNDLVGLGLRLDQFLLALVGRSKTFFDLLLAFFERLQDRRPNVLCTQPDKHDHRDSLADNCCV